MSRSVGATSQSKQILRVVTLSAPTRTNYGQSMSAKAHVEGRASQLELGMRVASQLVRVLFSFDAFRALAEPGELDHNHPRAAI